MQKTCLLDYYVDPSPAFDGLLHHGIDSLAHPDIAQQAVAVVMPIAHLLQRALVLPPDCCDFVAVAECGAHKRAADVAGSAEYLRIQVRRQTPSCRGHRTELAYDPYCFLRWIALRRRVAARRQTKLRL